MTVETNLAHNPGIQSAQAGQATVQRGNYELSVAQVDDTAETFRMVRLPAQHRIVSVVVEHDDLDTGAAHLIDIGIEDTVQDPADTTDLTLIAAAATIGQGPGTTRYETQAMLELPAVNYDRYIVIGVDTAAATAQAGGLAVNLVSRPDLPTHEGNYS